MVVLILSSASDPHAAAVAKHLEEMGATHRIWHYSQLLHASAVSFSRAAGLSANRITVEEQEEIALSDLQSIWCRRPGGFKSPRMPETWIESMVEMECKNAVGGLIRSMDCLLVNHPGSDSESLFKLSQLNAAQKLGLSIPPTLVTTEPEKAREFYEQFDGNVIYKLIGENTNFLFPRFEFPAGIPTMALRETDSQYFEQVKLAPHLFQQRIEKIFEVRATVVGEEIFAVRIDSQKGQSKTDWRLDYSVPMTAITLPDQVSNHCLEMMRHFSLNYAAFDFCVGTEEQYIFLELNCAGQYLWLEDRANLPISRQLAKLLTGKAKPIVAAGKNADKVI
jgi:glutathione synthase/RimK-type ligase-like ATP-grasp enzyme